MSFQSVREHRLAYIPMVYSGRFLCRQLVWTLTVENFKYWKFNGEYLLMIIEMVC